MSGQVSTTPIFDEADEARARAAIRAAFAADNSEDESNPLDALTGRQIAFWLRGVGLHGIRRDAALRATAEAVELPDTFAAIHTREALLVSNAHRSIGGRFSPAETRSLIESAIYILRDEPLRPQYPSPYIGPTFIAAQRRALANGARLAADGLEVETPAEPHDGCVGVLESFLGKIEQRFSDLGLTRVDDDDGGHVTGFQLFAREDTVVDRRSKVNVDKDSRERQHLRVAVHNDGPDAFANRVESGIADYLTVPGRVLEAERLIEAVCDERTALQWMRDEAVAELKGGPRHWCSAWGRVSSGASTYFNIVAGRLAAEGYEPLPARAKSKDFRSVAVGKHAIARARDLDPDLSIEQIDEIIAAGAEPIIALPNGPVVALRKHELPAFEKYSKPIHRPKFGDAASERRKYDQHELMAFAAGRGTIPSFLAGINISLP